MSRIVALAALIIGLVVPLSAQANSIPTTGTRIGLLAPPTTFQAGTPFYVTQGFTCETGKTACLSGLTHFDLYVDGQREPYATDLTFGTDGTLLSKFDLTNFPSGLDAGQHVFRGEWYYLGELVLTQTVAVDFI
jgi:hypothetical protein